MRTKGKAKMKKITLTANADTVKIANELGINLSALFRSALYEEVKHELISRIRTSEKSGKKTV